MSELALPKEVVLLRERNVKLVAVLRLVVVLLRVCEVTLVRRRISDGVNKRRLLRAVERSCRSREVREKVASFRQADSGRRWDSTHADDRQGPIVDSARSYLTRGWLSSAVETS